MRKQHCPFCNSLEVTHDFRGVDHTALLVAHARMGIHVLPLRPFVPQPTADWGMPQSLSLGSPMSLGSEPKLQLESSFMTIVQPHPRTLTPSQLRPCNCRHSKRAPVRFPFTIAHNFRINTTPAPNPGTHRGSV